MTQKSQLGIGAAGFVLLLAQAIGQAQTSNLIQAITTGSRVSATAAGGSFAPKFSADGRSLAFLSCANNLVTNDNRRPWLDLFVQELETGAIILASPDLSGTGGGNGNVESYSLSADGSRIVFDSFANDLCAIADTNNLLKTFVRDLSGKVTLPANLTYSNQFVYARQTRPTTISQDGRFVLFQTTIAGLETNGSANPNNLHNYIYRRDLQSNAIILASQSTNLNGVVNQFAATPSFSADGRFVAFMGYPEASSTSPYRRTIYLSDLAEGTTTCISTQIARIWLEWEPLTNRYHSYQPKLTPDGNYVAFTTRCRAGEIWHYDRQRDMISLVATNLPVNTSYENPQPLVWISDDGNWVVYDNGANVFAWDARTGLNQVVDVSLDGVTPGNGTAMHPSIAANGSKVIFVSNSTNLVLETGLTNGSFQIYVRDLALGETHLLSTNAFGQLNADYSACYPALNADGTLAAFDSTDGSLVENDFNHDSDVFTKNLLTGELWLVSRAVPGMSSATALGSVYGASISLTRDARYVAFTATDGELMPGDTNGYRDAVLWNMVTEAKTLVSVGTDGTPGNLDVIDANLSDDGRFVLFSSPSANLFSGQPPLVLPGINHLYLRDLQAGITLLVASNDASSTPAFSADGRYVAFASTATNLVDYVAITNGGNYLNIYLYDVQARTNILVSRQPNIPDGGKGHSRNPRFSLDSQWLVFDSLAPGLDPNQTNSGPSYLYVYSLAARTARLVSSASSANYRFAASFSANSGTIVFQTQSNISSFAMTGERRILAECGGNASVAYPAISDDGNRVAFIGTNYLGNASYGLYVNNLTNGQTTVIATGLADKPETVRAQFAADGDWVVFQTRNGLVSADTNGVDDIYLCGLTNHNLILLSTPPEGGCANGPSLWPVLGQGAQALVFHSFASDVVTNDQSSSGDAFSLRLDPGFVEGLLNSVNFIRQPTNRTCVFGATAIFQVAGGGTPPLSYRWYKGGAALADDGRILGAATEMLTLNRAFGNDTGEYRVVVSNAYSVVTSVVARLEVLDPFISTQPLAQTNYGGMPMQLAVMALGSEPLGLRWLKDGTNLAEDGRVSGTDEPGLQINPATGRDSGDYAVVVSNRYGLVTSTVAAVLVMDPYILTHPVSQYLTNGSSASISVNAGGSQPTRWLWRKDGVVIPGAETATLTFTNVQWGDTGDYDLVVSNAFGVLTSQVARLTVLRPLLLDDFDPGVDGLVRTIAVQMDGKILVGGNFSTLGGRPRKNLGRLQSDGTIDERFDPGADGSVNAIAIQADGRILIGGAFAKLGETACASLGRLQPDGALDATFAGSADGAVNAIAVQLDGRVVVGGSFASLGGQPRNRLGRLHVDGSLDEEFPAAPFPAAGQVNTVTIQSDGKVVAAGEAILSRFNSDGSLDASLITDANHLQYYSYFALLAQPDGKLMATGRYHNQNQTIFDLFRLLDDGGGDSSFHTEVYGFYPDLDGHGYISAVSLQADGKYVAGGGFSRIGLWWQPRQPYLARVEATGAADDSFRPTVNGQVVTSVLDLDGRILIGGDFSLVDGKARNRIARFVNTQPASFSVVISGTNVEWTAQGAAPAIVNCEFELSTNRGEWIRLGSGEWITNGWRLKDVAVPADANLRVRGLLTSSSGSALCAKVVSGPPVILSLSDDKMLAPGQNTSLMVLADGPIPLNYQWRKGALPLLGATNANLLLDNVQFGNAGSYDVVVSNLSGSITSRLVRVLFPLAPDTFNPNPSYVVYGFDPQPDGRTVLGGIFTQLAGTPRLYLGRVNADATIDDAFNPIPSSAVRALAKQDDGKLLVGGSFTTLRSQPHGGIARLTPDGNPDAGFNTQANSAVYSVIVQPDGRILLAGEFTTVNGQNRNRLARLYPDGSLDPEFNPGANATINVLGLQPDGKILAGGSFTNLSAATSRYLGRLNPDGSLDTGFAPAPDAEIHTLALQADGKIVVAGAFTNLNTAPRNRIGRLHPDGTLDNQFNPGANNVITSFAIQADDRIVVGGYFNVLAGQPCPFLGRLHLDGTLDSAFNPAVNNLVSAVGLQGDGAILLGGYFSKVTGLSRNNFARLSNTSPAEQMLLCDSNRIIWLRGATSPEVGRSTFDILVVGGAWTRLGEGRRFPSGWELTGLDLPARALVRARGTVSGGYHNGSSWLVEAIAETPNNGNRIFSLDRIGVSSGAAGSKQLNFNLQSKSNRTYQLVARPDLTSSTWLPEGPPIGATGQVLWFNLDLGTNGQRYYRVLQVP